MSDREVISEGTLPFALDRADSSLSVQVDENDPTWYVAFNVVWDEDGSRSRVRFAFRECIGARCGPDARTIGWLGVYGTSEWLEQRRAAHAMRAPGLEAVMASVRHYVICGGDLDCEILARGCSWDEISVRKAT